MYIIDLYLSSVLKLNVNCTLNAFLILSILFLGNMSEIF